MPRKGPVPKREILPDPIYRQSEFMLYAELRNKNWGVENATWAVTGSNQS